jgi:hypothetical protein
MNQLRLLHYNLIILENLVGIKFIILLFFILLILLIESKMIAIWFMLLRHQAVRFVDFITNKW